MKNLFRKIQNGLNMVTAVMLAMVVTIIFIQVIMRYVFGRSLAWSEELTRYIFVWFLYLGVNLGISDNIQLKIDVLDMKVTGKAYRILKSIQHVLSILACGAVTVGSFLLIRVGFYTGSPANHIPMWVIYLVFPVGMVMNIIGLIFRWKDDMKFDSKEEAEREGGEQV